MHFVINQKAAGVKSSGFSFIKMSAKSAVNNKKAQIFRSALLTFA